MKCVSALSTSSGTESAFEEVLGRVSADLGGTCADLAVVFVSADHAENLAGLAHTILSRKIARHVLGCTGESIIGDGREIEQSAAVSLWAVELPGVEIKTLRLDLEDDRFPDDIAAESSGTLLTLGDPFTFPAEEWFNRLPAGIRVVGGMASTSKTPGGNRLVLDDGEYDDGAIGIWLDSSAKVPHGRQPRLPADRPVVDRHQGRAERHPRTRPQAGDGSAPRTVRIPQPRRARHGSKRASSGSSDQ